MQVRAARSWHRTIVLVISRLSNCWRWLCRVVKEMGKRSQSRTIPQQNHQLGKATILHYVCVCVCAETSSQSREEEDIEGTMDQIFGGILRSDVVCAVCGYTSTAHDPFKDISVDVPEAPRRAPQAPAVDTPKPNPVRGSGKGSKGNGKGSNGKSQLCKYIWQCLSVNTL